MLTATSNHQNHSCDANCFITPVHINETDIQKPFLAIFTRKRIRFGDELTIDYTGSIDDDDDDDDAVEKVLPLRGLAACTI